MSPFNPSLSSIDLSIFLDVHKREFGLPPSYSYSGELYEMPGDYSTKLGHGICNPAWFYMLYDSYDPFFLLPSARDCLRIQNHIQMNKPTALRVMSLTLQPMTSYSSTEEEIAIFGVSNIAKKLHNTGMRKGIDAILERETPRILSCTDNLSPSFCASVRCVPSSEGVSIAFNHDITEEVFQNSDAIAHFANNLLKKPIPP